MNLAPLICSWPDGQVGLKHHWKSGIDIIAALAESLSNLKTVLVWDTICFQCYCRSFTFRIFLWEHGFGYQSVGIVLDIRYM